MRHRCPLHSLQKIPPQHLSMSKKKSKYPRGGIYVITYTPTRIFDFFLLVDGCCGGINNVFPHVDFSIFSCLWTDAAAGSSAMNAAETGASCPAP